jgi:hypothetical protein
MKKRRWKKIALGSLAVFIGLVVILAVHIYWVTRPHIDLTTRIMARIDLHQPISQKDVDKITVWLYRQKGVDHVLVNPGSQIALFTFAPVKNDGNRIVQDFRTSTPYNRAVRYLPVVDADAGGCPVASTSFTYKIYAFMKRVL